MSNARRAQTVVNFNGKNVDDNLKDILESLDYDDIATGGSDTLSIKLYNFELKWLKAWLPRKGDRITAKIKFHDWEKEGDEKSLDCGDFLLDGSKMSGGPLTASLDGIALPTDSAIKKTNRTKTWKKTTLQGIASEICKRYGLKLLYDGSAVKIDVVEQTEQSDSEFLFDLAKKRGFGMKIYKKKIIIYDKNKYERKKAVATLKRSSFVDDSWEWTDTLDGTYTGGKCTYKSNNNKKKGSTEEKEISVYVGSGEKKKGARTLKISEQASSRAEAISMIKAQVDDANRQACTLTGDIFPNPKVVAGVVVKIDSSLGKAAGRYFVDEVKTSVGSSATKQSITLHRIEKKCGASNNTPAKKKTAAKSKYKVGDVVNFHGGTHYISSYSNARGYSAKAGKAKITKMNGAGKAHPWHLIHVDSKSNVYGWVDDGTFD